tara:strand:- start:96 stop:830 length:735 start_codon:yes stop_codon:yes gene_type:complete
MGKEIDWFKTWFNSNYYHILYNNRSQQEANSFIENLVSKLKLQKHHNVLDLGCGKGRHSQKLSQFFKYVDGLDLSKENITKAKKHLKPNLNFYVGDMRNFKLKNKYNYIFNLFTSFGYFKNIEQNIDVLKCCHLHLENNGKILIDFLNPYPIKKNIVNEEIKQIDDIIFKINKSVNEKNVIKKITVVDGNKTHHFLEKVQLFEKKHFIKMLNESGFKLKSTFGNYQLDDYHKHSERLILWAKKI